LQRYEKKAYPQRKKSLGQSRLVCNELIYNNVR